MIVSASLYKLAVFFITPVQFFFQKLKNILAFTGFIILNILLFPIESYWSINTEMLILAIKEGSNAACCMSAVYSIHRPVRAPVLIYIHICICLQRTRDDQKSIMEPREKRGVV